MQDIRTLRTASYVIGLLLVVAGGMIYVCYRPLSLTFFSWIGASEDSGLLMTLRSSASSSLPDWCIYALPDGLWACAYVICIGAIWGFEYPDCIAFAMIIPGIGILSEILQAFRLMPGTFDWFDLAMYLSGGLFGWAYIYAVHKVLNKH